MLLSQGNMEPFQHHALGEYGGKKCHRHTDQTVAGDVQTTDFLVECDFYIKSSHIPACLLRGGYILGSLNSRINGKMGSMNREEQYHPVLGVSGDIGLIQHYWHGPYGGHCDKPPNFHFRAGGFTSPVAKSAVGRKTSAVISLQNLLLLRSNSAKVTLQ